jgi:AraC family transcriptional regulator, regulatory protein of adaptative response / methylated-DNA-[protein]-cysteine methyltransferase
MNLSTGAIRFTLARCATGRLLLAGTERGIRIARALGQPTAVRAVARVCATNPVSLVIPCHRVVREDGSLGGYRWSLERKQALLDKENTTSQKFMREGS